MEPKRASAVVPLSSWPGTHAEHYLIGFCLWSDVHHLKSAFEALRSSHLGHPSRDLGDCGGADFDSVYKRTMAHHEIKYSPPIIKPPLNRLSSCTTFNFPSIKMVSVTLLTSVVLALATTQVNALPQTSPVPLAVSEFFTNCSDLDSSGIPSNDTSIASFDSTCYSFPFNGVAFTPITTGATGNLPRPLHAFHSISYMYLDIADDHVSIQLMHTDLHTASDKELRFLLPLSGVAMLSKGHIHTRLL